MGESCYLSHLGKITFTILDSGAVGGRGRFSWSGGSGGSEFSHFPRRRGRQLVHDISSLAHWQFLHLPVRLQRQQQGILVEFERVKITINEPLVYSLE